MKQNLKLIHFRSELKWFSFLLAFGHTGFVYHLGSGLALKWAAEEINPKIRECLEVNTKLFLI